MQQAATLELGKSVERELAGGQVHVYQIALAEGQCASMIVEQRGIDVVVRVVGPDGKQIAEFDDELRPQGEEKPELVAGATGGYRLSVETKRQNTPAGSYAIRFTELRPATDKDRSLHDARGLLIESARLWRGGKYDAALAPAVGAVEAREKAVGPNHPDFAHPLDSLATVLRDRGDFNEAERLHQRALEIMEKALGPERPQVAFSLRNLGKLYIRMGNPDKAEPLYQRALGILEKALGPNHPEVSELLTNMAGFYAAGGDSERAITAQTRALPLGIAPGGVNSVHLADDAVTNGKIADNAVTTSELADGAVTSAKITAPLTLTSADANFTLSVANTGTGAAITATGNYQHL